MIKLERSHKAVFMIGMAVSGSLHESSEEPAGVVVTAGNFALSFESFEGGLLLLRGGERPATILNSHSPILSPSTRKIP